MRRLLVVPTLLLALLVGGCGGSSGTTASSQSATISSSTSPMTGSSASSSSGMAGSTCPTSNTRSFAKTRFVTDLGGSLFLMNRYVLKPYQAGKFRKGASGRTFALVKAAAAVATSTKLLKNATANAKANPTLCKTVAGPLTQLSNGLSGVVSGLRSGSFNGAALSGLSGLLGSVKSKATQAGIPVNEQSVGLGG